MGALLRGAVLLAVMAALQPTLAAAQAATPRDGSEKQVLRGRVVDQETGSPLYGAFVAPLGSDTGFLTDTQGNVALPLSFEDTYTLYSEQLGYETLELDVSSAAAGRPIEIQKQPHPIHSSTRRPSYRQVPRRIQLHL